MFTRNANQAVACLMKTKNGTKTDREASHYPETPAGWPNRATRRAVKHNKPMRLSQPWKAVLMGRPELLAAIRKL